MELKKRYKRKIIFSPTYNDIRFKLEINEESRYY